MKDQISNEEYFNQLKQEQMGTPIRDMMTGKLAGTTCATVMPGTTSSSITYTDSNFCWHRLPCGICRLTGMQCPKAGAYESPSYPYSPITWSNPLEGDSNKVTYAMNTCGETK